LAGELYRVLVLLLFLTDKREKKKRRKKSQAATAKGKFIEPSKMFSIINSFVPIHPLDSILLPLSQISAHFRTTGSRSSG